jgi:hypothetical protein
MEPEVKVEEPKQRRRSPVSWREIDQTLECLDGDRHAAAKMLCMTRNQLARSIHNNVHLSEKWKLKPVDDQGGDQEAESLEPTGQKKGFRVVEEVLQKAGLSVDEARRAQHLHAMAQTQHNTEMIKIMGGGIDILGMKLFTRIAEIEKRLQDREWIHDVPRGQFGATGSTRDEEKMLLDTYTNLVEAARKIYDSRSDAWIKAMGLQIKADGGGKRQKPGFKPLEEPED